MRSRNYMYTVNNPEGQLAPEEDEWELYHATFTQWQLEVGDTGTPHFQGYLELDSPCSLNQVKAIPGLEDAHFDVRRGTQAQALAYTSKEASRVEGPWTWGVLKAQGVRSDLGGLRALVDEGEEKKREKIPVRKKSIFSVLLF